VAVVEVMADVDEAIDVAVGAIDIETENNYFEEQIPAVEVRF
jgi:hypothetical protein